MCMLCEPICVQTTSNIGECAYESGVYEQQMNKNQPLIVIQSVCTDMSHLKEKVN